MCQPEVPAKSLQAGDHFINRKYYACDSKRFNTPPFGLQALHQVLNLAQNVKHIRIISRSTCTQTVPGCFTRETSCSRLVGHSIIIPSRISYKSCVLKRNLWTCLMRIAIRRLLERLCFGERRLIQFEIGSGATQKSQYPVSISIGIIHEDAGAPLWRVPSSSGRRVSPVEMPRWRSKTPKLKSKTDVQSPRSIKGVGAVPAGPTVLNAKSRYETRNPSNDLGKELRKATRGRETGQGNAYAMSWITYSLILLDIQQVSSKLPFSMGAEPTETLLLVMTGLGSTSIDIFSRVWRHRERAGCSKRAVTTDCNV